jgi:phenylpropionate dioxygenase-like ring-hydroxylating dioxygenase large terminal subunit
MDAATETSIARRFLELAGRGETTMADGVLPLDPSTYVDPDHFECEQDVLFRRGEVVVALGADVQEPGDFLAVESGGLPVLLVRGGDGRVRAFLNVCSHRASPVATGCGHTVRTFSCPFHGWVYDVDDGALVGQPRSCGGFESVDRGELGLRPVPVAERRGIVMVRPGGGAPIDVDRSLCGLADEVDGYDLTSYRVFGRQRTVWQCNWKLLVDTFLESYHVFALHRRLIGDRYEGHIMLFDGFGPHMRVPVPRPSLFQQSDGGGTLELLPHTVVQYFLNPNVILTYNADRDAPMVTMSRFVPVAVDQTIADITAYAPHDATSDAEQKVLAERFELHTAVTNTDDYPISERIHRALASGAVERTVLGRNEAAVVRFHCSLAERLAAAALTSD